MTDERAGEVWKEVLYTCARHNQVRGLPVSEALKTAATDIIRQALADAKAEGAREEREKVVWWLEAQSDEGANLGIASEKGSTRRAAFGGGSLALHKAATAIEKGAHHEG